MFVEQRTDIYVSVTLSLACRQCVFYNYNKQTHTVTDAKFRARAFFENEIKNIYFLVLRLLHVS